MGFRASSKCLRLYPGYTVFPTASDPRLLPLSCPPSYFCATAELLLKEHFVTRRAMTFLLNVQVHPCLGGAAHPTITQPPDSASCLQQHLTRQGPLLPRISWVARLPFCPRSSLCILLDPTVPLRLMHPLPPLNVMRQGQKLQMSGN